MGEIKAVVFDWDGTIVNTMPFKLDNAGQVFAKHFDVSPKEIALSYKAYSGIARRDLFNLIAKDHIGRELTALEFNQLSQFLTTKNLESYKRNQVFDETNREILGWLKDNNISLFISSSAIQREINELAEYLKISDYFTEILGSREGFKKGKDHLDYLRNKYHLDSNKIIFVGDEKADMRLSGRLAIRCVGISQTADNDDLHDEFADLIISDLSGLRDIISRA